MENYSIIAKFKVRNKLEFKTIAICNSKEIADTYINQNLFWNNIRVHSYSIDKFDTELIYDFVDGIIFVKDIPLPKKSTEYGNEYKIFNRGDENLFVETPDSLNKFRGFGGDYNYGYRASYKTSGFNEIFWQYKGGYDDGENYEKNDDVNYL